MKRLRNYDRMETPERREQLEGNGGTVRREAEEKVLHMEPFYGDEAL
jgi:hypothetical protein